MDLEPEKIVTGVLAGVNLGEEEVVGVADGTIRVLVTSYRPFIVAFPLS